MKLTNELRSAIIANALAAVSTVKKLLEVWSEAKAFLPDWALAGKTANLPMVKVDELNEMLAQAKKTKETVES